MSDEYTAADRDDVCCLADTILDALASMSDADQSRMNVLWASTRKEVTRLLTPPTARAVSTPAAGPPAG